MARSIIDKCDVACIVCRVTQEEEELISDIPTNIIPNQVMDVYKVRRGRYTNVKIWSYADLGTCRKEDLFVTTAEFDTVDEYRADIRTILIRFRNLFIFFLPLL